MAPALKHPVFVVGSIGIVIGALLMLGAEQFDRLTTTEAFCAESCHSMRTHVADEETYRKSIHRNTASGVRAGCADCHVPKGLIPATWAHIWDGTRDLLAELGNDFTQPGVWEARREQLAWRVRDAMLANDSRTCRSCHQREAVLPQRERGQRQHELGQRHGISCIGCHFNLVHAAVQPRESFLDKVKIPERP